jgi:hypothetical protein
MTRRGPASGGHTICRVSNPEHVARANIEYPDSDNRVDIALGSFAAPKLNQWAKEVSSFVEAGRLVYLPQRLAWVNSRGDFQNSYFTMHPSWSTWTSPKVTVAKNDTVLPEASGLCEIDKYSHLIFDFGIPFLQGISLDMLYRVMEDEQDALGLTQK